MDKVNLQQEFVDNRLNKNVQATLNSKSWLESKIKEY